RKRPGGAVGSRPARKRSRLLPSSAGGTSQAEPPELEEGGTSAFEPAGSRVFMWFLKASISTPFQDGEQSQQEPYLSRASDDSSEPLARDDEEPRDTDDDDDEYLHVLFNSVPSRGQPRVVVRCPICMDTYSEIMQRGRQLMSTLCGHVFCSRCILIALDAAHMCPTCKRELTPERYHPIFL
ncbi:RNF4 ligase, partial [Certhia familiaris]|nr:RNF4 ligase [Certhia familiaris]